MHTMDPTGFTPTGIPSLLRKDPHSGSIPTPPTGSHNPDEGITVDSVLLHWNCSRPATTATPAPPGLWCTRPQHCRHTQIFTHFTSHPQPHHRVTPCATVLVTRHHWPYKSFHGTDRLVNQQQREWSTLEVTVGRLALARQPAHSSSAFKLASKVKTQAPSVHS